MSFKKNKDKIVKLNFSSIRRGQRKRAGKGTAPTGDNVPCIPEIVGEFYS